MGLHESLLATINCLQILRTLGLKSPSPKVMGPVLCKSLESLCSCREGSSHVIPRGQPHPSGCFLYPVPVVVQTSLTNMPSLLFYFLRDLAAHTPALGGISQSPSLQAPPLSRVGRLPSDCPALEPSHQPPALPFHSPSNGT